jgi:hypothetical protein
MKKIDFYFIKAEKIYKKTKKTLSLCLNIIYFKDKENCQILNME